VNATNGTISNITANASLADGYYTWRIACTSGTDTGYSGNRLFTLDATAPTGSMTTPGSSTYVPGATTSYNIAGFASDTFGIYTIRIISNGVFNGSATWNSTTTAWNYTINNLTAGTYNISALINDSNNNTFQLNGTLIVTTAPVINITTPANNTNYTGVQGSMLQLNFSANDASGNISACWYNISGTMNATNVSIANCTTNASTLVQLYLANGTYTLVLYANDSFNNIGTSTRIFRVNDTDAPNMTSALPTGSQDSSTTTVTLSITTDENATCAYSATDINYSLMTNFSSNNLTAHTQNYSVSAGTSYTIYTRCMDMSGNINNVSSTISFSVAAVPVAATPSSSGGSGGATVLLADNSKSISYDILPAGLNTLKIDSKDIPLSEVALSTLAVSKNVQFIITIPTTPKTTYSRKVYQYIQIDHAAINNSNIESARFKFKVAKLWLTANNINKEDITLLRYDSTWNPLATTILSEDQQYVYYKAVSNGLSLFAISTKENSVPMAPTAPPTSVVGNTQANTQNNANEDAAPMAAPNNAAPNKKSFGGNSIGWVLLALMVIIILIIIYSAATAKHKKR